jgi:SAM-dependent methyltransferase
MQPWHEDDRFWAVLETFLFDEEKKRAAVEDAGHAVRLLGVDPGAEILDLGCGPGRHSVELAKRGFRVTGVDRTARYLDKARTYASDQGVKVEFVLDDMRTFRRPAAFDGAVNLYTSFGYFDDQEEDRRVLRNLRESLRPGARLMMEMAGKEILARIYTPKDWIELPDGSLLLFEREVEPGWTIVKNRWISIRNGERTEFHFTHRVYSAAELSALLTEAGFAVEAIYGGLDGSPYDRQAQRLVAVARA